jgi:hypothetical protein
MTRRFASINELPTGEAVRPFHWPLGRRLDDLHASARSGSRGSAVSADSDWVCLPTGYSPAALRC